VKNSVRASVFRFWASFPLTYLVTIACKRSIRFWPGKGTELETTEWRQGQLHLVRGTRMAGPDPQQEPGNGVSVRHGGTAWKGPAFSPVLLPLCLVLTMPE